MAAAQDLELSDNDLKIDSKTGDFAIAESDIQHIEDIIVSFFGYWKEFPFVGVGIGYYLGASINPQELLRLIKVQLQADGYKVGNPKAEFQPNGRWLIQPNAIRN